MNSEFIIELSRLRFFAYHGLYEEEKIHGGEYLVDLKATVQPPAERVQHISETVNYESLFEIVKEKMAQPCKLLEMVAQNIADAVRGYFPMVSAVEIRITKLSPPISDFNGEVAVNLKKEF